MTKGQTNELKGVAILMMIWGHLFGSGSHVMSSYCPLLFCGDIPLVTIISRATGPVAFFLLLSGYGLYCVNQKGDKHRFDRILRLVSTYWIVLLLVIGVSYIIYPERYQNSLPELFVNVIGLDPTYIPESWFMLPYIILALTAPWEFRLLGGVRSRYILPVAFLLNLVTSFLLSRYGEDVFYPNRLLYVGFCWFHFQFSFLVGMCMARESFESDSVTTKWESLKARFKKQRFIVPVFLCLLVAFRCLMQTSAIHSIYVCLFVLLWILLKVPSWLSVILSELGRRSTAMWFVHTSLGLYLFADFFNTLRNPILVFLAVTIASWLVACLVDWVRGLIFKLQILSRSCNDENS